MVRLSSSSSPFQLSLSHSRLTEDVHHLIEVAQVAPLCEDVAHLALHALRNAIHILRLDRGLQILLQDLCEVVLKLAATEIRQNSLPVRRTLK